MKKKLFLFCGGSNTFSSDPKPLIKLSNGQTLLSYYLKHIEKNYSEEFSDITLLCDENHIANIWNNVKDIKLSNKLILLNCGNNSTTFEKIRKVSELENINNQYLHFSYPDIFDFNFTEKNINLSNEDNGTNSYPFTISIASFTCRFPTIIVNHYTGEVKGISNYSSSTPANPVHIFSGDIYVNHTDLRKNIKIFDDQNSIEKPSLEYDFIFWLINNNKIVSKISLENRLWVDSIRDMDKLIQMTEEFS